MRRITNIACSLVVIGLTIGALSNNAYAQYQMTAEQTDFIYCSEVATEIYGKYTGTGTFVGQVSEGHLGNKGSDKDYLQAFYTCMYMKGHNLSQLPKG